MRVLDEKEVKARRNRLLQTVILEFIRTAKPVSSSSIADLDGMDLSSATVRNLLHQLEEDGYLEHPHTSAGKLPTDKGYRYYVDYLLNLQEHLIQEEDRIQKEYIARQQQMEEVLTQTSRMLAFLSHHAGFVLQPKLEESNFQRLDVIALDQGRWLMVVVASNGSVRSKIIQPGKSLGEANLRSMIQWANSHFRGRSFRDFCLEFSQAVEDEAAREAEARQGWGMLNVPIESLGRELHEVGLLLEGASNVIKAPDVAVAPGYLADVAAAFEDREQMTQIIRKEMERARPMAKGELSILIGRESENPVFQQLSLVTKAFETDDQTVGFLGIIGPKRMEYGRMVALVENIQAALQKVLKGGGAE